jgi:hypothetical protein
LDADVDSRTALDIDLGLILFNNNNILADRVVTVSLQGIAGEVVYTTVDLSGLNLSGNVFVSLDLQGDVDLDSARNINLSLGIQLFSVLGGLLQPILGILYNF